MEWFILAIASLLIFSLNNVINKILVTKKIKDAFSFNLASYIFNIAIIIPLIFVLRLTFNFASIMAIFYGFAFALIWVLYYKALMKEEVTRISMITSTTAIFVLLFSSVFLNESMSTGNYVGVILLVLSAFLASYKKSNRKLYFTSALTMIVIFVLGQALLLVLSKYALSFTDYWNFSFWTLIGGLLGFIAFLLIPIIRKNFIKEIHVLDKRIWLTIIISSALSFIANLLLNASISIGNISLITALLSARPLVLFFFTTVLTIFVPRILREEMSKKTIFIKLLAAAMIIIGSYLIVT